MIEYSRIEISKSIVSLIRNAPNEVLVCRVYVVVFLPVFCYAIGQLWLVGNTANAI
jgi:hypothetical protein